MKCNILSKIYINMQSRNAVYYEFFPEYDSKKRTITGSYDAIVFGNSFYHLEM